VRGWRIAHTYKAYIGEGGSLATTTTTTTTPIVERR